MNRHYQLMIIFPLLLLIITACAGDREEKTTSPPTPITTIDDQDLEHENDGKKTKSTLTAVPSRSGAVETASFQGVIFTAEQIAASEHWPNNDDPWTPSEADIMALEKQLTGYLQEEHPPLWQKLGNYTRQYWGTATPHGNRAVYANFICDAERISSYMDWRADRVEVLDGGDCYFQTIYDIENGVFVWLAINGES